MKRFSLLFVLMVTLLFIGCAGEKPEDEGSTPDTKPEDLPVESSDISIPIEDFQTQPHMDLVMDSKVGGDLVLVLGSNPTTGFQWQENVTISDKDILEQINHRFVASESGAVGSPGQDVWTFKALKKGIATISLECSRPWEERDIDNWTVNITVTIK